MKLVKTKPVSPFFKGFLVGWFSFYILVKIIETLK